MEQSLGTMLSGLPPHIANALHSLSRTEITMMCEHFRLSLAKRIRHTPKEELPDLKAKVALVDEIENLLIQEFERRSKQSNIQ